MGTNSILRGFCVPTQSVDCTKERPYRFGCILPGPELDPGALVGLDLDGGDTAVDRVRVRPLGHDHIRDLIREPFQLVHLARRQPSIDTDLAVILDNELITADRGDAIVVHHPAADADRDLHASRVPRKPRVRSLVEPASGQTSIEDLIDLGLVSSVPACGEQGEVGMVQSLACSVVGAPRHQELQ